MQAQPERPQPEKPAQECFVPLYMDSLHDLAGPVNQISTMFDLYLRRHEAPSEEQAVLSLLRTSTGRLQKLMTALRDYARLAGSPPELRSSDGNALLAGALSSVDSAIRESGARVTHDELPHIDCDPAQMIYVLTSLIDNAIKFRGEAPSEVHISAAGVGDDWIFSVRDNGIGIAPRYWESVFHMFSRINGEIYAGSGAGLAITRRIIEQHGGRIWLDSEPGRGSTFFFTIPGR